MKSLWFFVLFIPLISSAQTPRIKYWETLHKSRDTKKLETVLTAEIDDRHIGKLSVEEKILALSMMATIRINQKNYSNALRLLARAKTISTQNSNQFANRYYSAYAYLFDKIGAYNLSLHYRKKSNIHTTDPFAKYLHLGGIGSAYIELCDYDNAIVYFSRQCDIAYTLKDSIHIASAYNNLAFTCYKKGDFSEAKKYYQKSLSFISEKNRSNITINPQKGFYYMILQNIGLVYYELKEYEMAERYLSKAFADRKSYCITDPNEQISGEVCLVLSLLKMGKLKGAEDIIRQFEPYYPSMSNTKKLAVLEMNLEFCLLTKQNDVAEKLLGERRKLVRADEEDKRIKQSSMSDLISQFMVDSYAQELKNEKIQQKLLLKEKNIQDKKIILVTVLWVVSSLVLVLLLIVARQIGKNRQHKHKLEKELKAVEDERLQLKLKIQENSLTNLALEVVRKQEVSENLVQKMTSIIRQDDENVRLKLQSMLRDMKTDHKDQSGVDDDNHETILLLKEFQQRLRKSCDNISKSEIELSSYIRLHFSNKKIASIKNCTENTVKTAKNRLKKKFQLGPSDSLTKFIQDI